MPPLRPLRPSCGNLWARRLGRRLLGWLARSRCGWERVARQGASGTPILWIYIVGTFTRLWPAMWFADNAYVIADTRTASDEAPRLAAVGCSVWGPFSANFLDMVYNECDDCNATLGGGRSLLTKPHSKVLGSARHGPSRHGGVDSSPPGLCCMNMSGADRLERLYSTAGAAFLVGAGY